MSTADRPGPRTVVLIHGQWMTPLSWEHWVALGQRGWEEVADYAIDWAEGQLEAQAAG